MCMLQVCEGQGWQGWEGGQDHRQPGRQEQVQLDAAMPLHAVTQESLQYVLLWTASV